MNSCGFVVPGFRNIMVDRVFMNRMLVYSARNSSANGPAENSTLNPETSSDSPSVRSKGDRFVSARVDVNHIMANGHAGIRSQTCSCVSVKSINEYPPDKVAMEIMISPRVTSYEMICATARMAPIRGYFELEDQPDQRMAYVNIPDMAMMKSNPRFMLVRGVGIGIGAQDVSARVSAIMGDSVNRIGEDMVGFVASFVISFSPSAIGCSRPIGPTRFGPLRCCIYPRSFRSNRVRNATAIRIDRM